MKNKDDVVDVEAREAMEALEQLEALEDLEHMRAVKDTYRERLASSARQIKFGLGIGVVGTATAAVGIVCPLCFFVAPALVGTAIWDRRKARTELLNWPDAPDFSDEPNS